MICPQCGSQVDDGAYFCPSCGCRIPLARNTTASSSPYSHTKRSDRIIVESLTRPKPNWPPKPSNAASSRPGYANPRTENANPRPSNPDLSNSDPTNPRIADSIPANPGTAPTRPANIHTTSRTINAKASFALLLGVLSIIFSYSAVAGIVFGIAAIAMAASATREGNGDKARSGKIAGTIGIVLSIIFILAAIGASVGDGWIHEDIGIDSIEQQLEDLL